MKMKLMKNKKIFAANISGKVLVSETTIDLMLRVSKSYVPFTSKFHMIMHFCADSSQGLRAKK